MATLAELKAKWFLQFLPGETVIPQDRYPGSLVEPFRDGNQVEFIIDGANYMQRWHDFIKTLRAGDCEIYHSARTLTQVLTSIDANGQRDPNSNALTVIKNAHDRNVECYLLLGGHITNLPPNLNTLRILRGHGISQIWLDERYPVLGSLHAKYSVLKNPASADQAVALVSSCDITDTRWDTLEHLPENPLRNAPATHEVGAMIRGPAVTDIEMSFRDRFEDRGYFRFPTTEATPPAVGGHSVQLLRTYGRTYSGHSWAVQGEFTCWASYLKAIQNASNFIYIEDQYFMPFDWPPAFNAQGPARDTDVIYQLGKAIQRGVSVIVLIPKSSEDPGIGSYQTYQRNVGVHYLASLAASANGKFVIAYLSNSVSGDTTDVHVHSKVMVVDDEFAVIGSTNINQRSMTHDTELAVGIVDEDNQFAHDLRTQLWAEHLQSVIPIDVDVAINLFETRTRDSLGRVRPYSVDEPDPPAYWHEFRHVWEARHRAWLRDVIDPYAGPIFIRSG